MNEDSLHDRNKKSTNNLERIREHILVISKGNCNISDKELRDEPDEQTRLILGGLKLLHEDLEAYKGDVEAKLQAEHKIEILKKKKDEELAQFSHVASHDLQEPLRTITNFSSRLKASHIDNLNAEGQMCVKYIHQSSQRMSNLIYDLLMYSRIGSDCKREVVNCNEVVKDVLDDMKAVIEVANPIWNIGLLPTVRANKTAIHQLFLNLIGNAIKFRNPSKQLIIDITATKHGASYQFLLSDNGLGIDKQHIDKIFGIFQRLHNNNQYEGTGIGLAYCRKIVEMHGGSIFVESTINESTTFHFSISDISDPSDIDHDKVKI